jgi:hypothetical protein
MGTSPAVVCPHGLAMVPVMNDYPTPDVYPMPDLVIALQRGDLLPPPRDGFKATHDHDETCELCRLHVLHVHGNAPTALYPF